MLSVLSPAKSLDYESKLPTRKHSEPRMLDDSSTLIDILAPKTPGDIQKMMGVSASLAELNAERFNDWEVPFTTKNARPAALAFAGDVYRGLEAGTFSERDFTHAQKSVRILSGLYGLLRPLDLMQPYRLEMGTKLKNPRGRDLYAFWRERVTAQLAEDIAESPGPDVLVNLASNEYFGAVVPMSLDAKVIAPQFLDSSNGGDFKIVSFFAKQARGSMAGWMVRTRVSSIRGLKDFDDMGYSYDAERSTASRPVYTRTNG